MPHDHASVLCMNIPSTDTGLIDKSRVAAKEKNNIEIMAYLNWNDTVILKKTKD